MNFWRFIGPAQDLGPELTWTFDYQISLLGLLIAIAAAMVMLPCIERTHNALSTRARWQWLSFGAIVMGGGIWSMHFVAMVAMSLPVEVKYHLGVTIASIVPAIVGCGLLLFIMARAKLLHQHILYAALALALGIGSMHYLGMEAMRSSAVMHYEPTMFALSIGTAYALALLALYINTSLKKWTNNTIIPTLAGAIFLGMAVTGMHYSAMYATHFHAGTGTPVVTLTVASPGSGFNNIDMFVALIIVAILIATVLTTSLLDARLEKTSRTLEEKEAQQSAIAKVILDGQIIADQQGAIQSFNPAAELMFGYRCDEVIGQNLSILMPAPHRDAHQGYINRHSMINKSRIFKMRSRRDLFGRRKDGSLFPIEILVNTANIGEKLFYVAGIQDISDLKNNEDKLQRMVAAVHCSVDAIDILDTKGRILYVNPAWEKLYGRPLVEVTGTMAHRYRRPEREDKNFQAMIRDTQRGKSWSGHLKCTTDDGQSFVDMVSISPICNNAGKLTSYVTHRRDVTEQVQLERQLVQAQKLESIGQLAAGIAHEINTPTQYVSDNTVFLQNAFNGLMEAVQGSEQLLEAVRQGPIGANDIAQFETVLKKARLNFLKNQVAPAFEQSLEGLEQISRIVGAMKEFSHPAQEKTTVDLNRAIQNTITVASNEWKYVAEMRTEFDPALPPVSCLPGEFNQVILNILVNAAHAIGEVVGDGSDGRGVITVSTHHSDKWTEIRIRDTGTGMSADVKERIFDAFFTTKEVGKGTGQGLSIAYNVVVEKHGGTIDVESKHGKGTTFVIRLPLHEPTAAEAEEQAA